MLLAEVTKRLTEWKVPYKYNKSEKEIHVGEQGVVYGATSENPEAILGLSEIHCLVLDEASYLCEQLYTWGCDRCRGRTVKVPKIRLFTSPDSFSPAHVWFLDLCAKYPRAVINASALDNIYTSPEFKADLLERYPPGTDLYLQQVEGKIVSSRSANVAIDDRTFMNSRPPHSQSAPVWIGLDLAGQGRDDSVFVVIDDYGIVETVRYHHAETQVLVSQLLEYNRKYIVGGVALDGTGGFGAGVFDYSKSSFRHIDSINFGSKADEEHFNNLRTQLHFDMRKTAEGSAFYVPMTDDGAKIREESRHALYYIDPKGKTAMFPKEDIKKALGRSPDALDALLLANRARLLSRGELNNGEGNVEESCNRMLAAFG